MNLYKIKIIFEGTFSDHTYIYVLAKDFNEANDKVRKNYAYRKVESIKVVATKDNQNLIV